eukprot:6247965-Alexandrium_andersonii.AAC.1
MVAGGNVCTPWSAMGKRGGVVGPLQLALRHLDGQHHAVQAGHLRAGVHRALRCRDDDVVPAGLRVQGSQLQPQGHGDPVLATAS